ncbi:MAG: lipoyl(octanoyl) transferase LipB [Candidatus Palauibacterales bacterium]|nr:lipoyl(octanoyl) transferase LipB [Candidatus Palauibacterales bacterium]MDP2530401.1 lipoyl(octanoyl) transferase LipB [Candidatus Palauibacterales bacterium]MDP2585087.1 lipoyl(octanoyl) transferase LipB [Candidatus Palauibacterales bacterium]
MASLAEIVQTRVPGRVQYRRGLDLQRALGRARIEGRLGEDLLLLVEHEPVVTLGRGTEAGHLLAGPDGLAARGVDLVEIERGGDVTYHGPGQIVGYPILDLRRYRRDLHWYLRTVEEALIRALAELSLPAFRVAGHTGVWVGEEGAILSEGAIARGILAGSVRKIASIGVHVSRWVTWHGFALNVTDEPLENFRLIVPCGIDGVRMTSLAAEGVGVGAGRLGEALATGFSAAFEVRVRRETSTLEALRARAGSMTSAAGRDAAGRDRSAERRRVAGGGAT